MKIASFIAATALVSAAVPLAAQQGSVSPQCSAIITQDACQKALDIFQFMAPQLGAAIAGGNATLGVGGTLGGLGHIYVSGRANVVSSQLPSFDQVAPSTTGAHSDDYPTEDKIAGVPAADVAIGLFRGFPVGVTNVGGIDLLGSISYLPTLNASGLHMTTPNGAFKFGGGVRVGIVQESILFPGISVTYLRRGLPTVDLLATNPGGDSLRIDNINVTTDSYRIVASKNLLALGIAAGVGQDRYTTSAEGSGYVAARGDVGTPSGSLSGISMSQKMSRTTYFIDGTFNLPFFKIIGEVGRASAVNIPTYNTFGGSVAGGAQTFGSIGVRLGL